jgi:hypothetical protein
MASLNGVLSPPPLFEALNSSMNLSAKRKRDDSMEAPNPANGTPDPKTTTLSEPSIEESQALVRDLIDVLKE